MTKIISALSLAAIVVIPGTPTHALTAMGEQAVPAPRQFISTSDKQLRAWAITSPPPKYPPASLGKRVTGVVVAAVLFSDKGANERVDIIQSPDAETGRAVRDAVMQWRLRPMVWAAKATLAFYFQMKGREGVVLGPEEMRALTNPGATHVKRENEPPLKQITAAEFRALVPQSGTLLLDIRDRETFGEGHEKGAVNIPFQEMLLRAPAELPVARHIVIDCRDPLELCAMGVHWLVSSGFGHVSVLRR